MDKEKLKLLLKSINTLSSPPIPSDESTAFASRVASDGSRSSPLQEEEANELLSVYSRDYQLTVRSKITLTRRQQSLLLDILNYQSVYFGMSFGMYLCMEFLSGMLIGNKADPLEIRDSKERLTVMVSQILLSSLGDSDLNLIIRNDIHPAISQKLIEEKLLMEKRVYGSRHFVYKPEAILEIRTVPLDVYFERQKGNSERYSSYCKGYGESHPSARKLKTKPSFELDGEQKDVDSISLRDLHSLFILTSLEVRAKFHRKRKKS